MLEDFLLLVARWQRALEVSRKERAYFGWRCDVESEAI